MCRLLGLNAGREPVSALFWLVDAPELHVLPSVVVASEELDGEDGWRMLASGELVHVRPDLTVEGTIELEKLNDVLYLGRPAGAQPDATVELFKLTKDGDLAVRTKVHLGRSSVSTIEVREGLAEGDVVVLSDMNQYDNAERVRLR